MIKTMKIVLFGVKLGYAIQTFTTLIDLDDPFATITGDFKTIECTARMIVIANSQKYGTGVTINPNGAMDDGSLNWLY
jgi:diacylglycerol kinase family enzyme